ncbi:MAG: ThuA domain-containing protein [Treponema sp.]|jgi:trehalose utilization protein|nr:ThuA domain-containing protein [Treponema sp.]
MSDIRVTVWNEYQDEQKREEVTKVYPNGLHVAIADFLNREGGIKAKCSVITDPDQGFSEEILDDTDVMVYWAHMLHHIVEDRFAQRLVDRVQRGMGIVFLHSAHRSKAFCQLLGTSGRISWREAEERCRVWAANPQHPIAAGVPLQFVIDHEEMYSEPFGIPNPDDTVFISWFQGGNVLRSGVTFHREFGKIFYFQPGHETYPNYFNRDIQRVITNAVKWAASAVRIPNTDCPNDTEPLEKLN